MVDNSTQKTNEIDELLPKIFLIKESCNLTGWEHFSGKLWTWIFPDIGKQKTAVSFVLNYFQQKVMIKFYEISKKLHFGHFLFI